MRTEEYYLIELDNYAMPGFVSFSKEYLMTISGFKEWLEELRKDENMVQQWQILSEALQAFLDGQKYVTHQVAYRQVPFAKQVTLLHSESTSFDNHQWEHINTWGFPYRMRCEHVETRHFWLKCDGYYSRYMEARFTNLEYESSSGKWDTFGDSFWGYPGVLVTEGNITRNLLAEPEKEFETFQEVKSDWQSFCQEPKPDFTEFCNDIFGDG